MKIKTLLPFLLSAFFCTPTFARIGETEKQTDVRYGKPVLTRTESALRANAYRYKGFNIIVTFENGVSVMEQFWKRNGLVMTPGELIGILAANVGPSGRWGDPQQDGFMFYRHERNRFAEYNSLTGRLIIAVPDALKRVSGRINSADLAKMKGF